MIALHLVGCGALGSIFAEEFSRRVFALHIQNSVRFVLYDFDYIEERNCASQLYLPSTIGQLKTEALAKRVRTFNVKALQVPIRVISYKQLKPYLDDTSILIDTVDSFETRQDLCRWGIINNIPVLHGALGDTDFGFVSWTTQYSDTFSMSPYNLSDKDVKTMLDTPQPTAPPCELVLMRPTIFLTAFAMVTSLWAGLNFDNLAQPKQLDYIIDNYSWKKVNETIIPSLLGAPKNA